MRKLVLAALLCVAASATAQTLFLNDSAVTVSSPLRGGMNLGSFTSYDSGQMLKNLLRSQNWSFEPNQLHQIFALTASGTTTSFSNTDVYAEFTANSMAGSTFTVVNTQLGGAELGCSGTIASNTTGNGSTVASIYTINSATSQGNSGCSAAFTPGDIVLIEQSQSPTPESCWEASGNCGITGSVTHGGKLTTDAATPWDGQQALVLDVSAAKSATADARLYFNNNTVNIFALINGTYTATGYVRSYSGVSTPLQIAVTTPVGQCSGSVTAPTSTWSPFSVTCSFAETSQTTPENHWIDFTAAGSGGLGAVEIDDVSFQKTSGQDGTNTTVFRDEAVAALRAVCATGTPGPPCLVRDWSNQNGETTANWTASAGAAATTTAGPVWASSGETTPQLQEYLNLVELVGGLPYFVFPCTATTTDATNFIDYMSSTNISSGYGQIRASQGQSAPWVGAGGIFSTVWVSFCNEAWNGSSFLGQGLPFRGTAGPQYYYDYANRAKDIYSAMRGDSNFSSNMKLGFDLQMIDNSGEGLSASLGAMAAVGGAADFAELAPYTQDTVSNWSTDAGLWQSAMEEPWANVADPTSLSTFYQNVSLVQGINACGPSGTKACTVAVYEEADSTQATCGLAGDPACSAPTYTAIDQTHEDYITAGAGQGVIAPLQMLLNQQQLGVSAQNYFALSGFENGTLGGSTAGYSKLWGCAVDMGGSTSYLNQASYTFRPACLGLQVANQSIIGPEYSAIFSGGLPTYNWAGDAYNGPTEALPNVPYIYAFCFKALSSGSARSCVLINTSLTNSYNVAFASSSVPTGSCTLRQFAPGAIDDMNEAATGTNTNATAATVSITTNSISCPSSLVLPVDSVTGLDFTSTGSSPAVAPTYSPVAGTYATAQTVTISDTTPNAIIYYTTDGSTPTNASAMYSYPIVVNTTESLNAIAVATTNSPSAIATAAFTINQPATPTFSPGSGTYTSQQVVTINDVTQATTIYYTTDGSAPTTSSTIYNTPIAVNATEVLKAIAVVSDGSLVSAVGAAPYTITSTPPAINFSSGFTSTGLNLYGASINNGELELTDGGSGESHVAWFTTPVNVQAFTSDFTFQNTAATANGFTFAIQNASAGIFAVGGNGSGLGYSGIGSSTAVKFDLYNSAGEGSDSTGFYTNGATPTLPAVDMTASGVNLHSADLLQAHVTYDGTIFSLTLTDTVTGASFTTSTAVNIPMVVGGNKAYVGFTGGTGASSAIQNVLTWTYVPDAPTPVFSPTAGSYYGSQTVAINDSNPSTAIYYTIDGSAPTTSSSKYSAPITVASNQKISAIAVGTGLANSTVGSAAYTIFPAAAAPTYSPSAGIYSTTQTVAINDVTSGVSIYYTLDGTAPSTSSTLYTGPITIASTATINAIATKAGIYNSPVSTATYTIAPATSAPSFFPASGAYGSTQTVTISDATAGAAIYYTTNGTAPTTASATYTAPITVSATQTINAIAIAPNYAVSAVDTATYTINGPASTPTFSPSAGSYGPAQTVTISDATPGSSMYYTTNGSAPGVTSTLYTAPITVGSTETIKAIAVAATYANSATGSAAYTINGAAATPTFSPVAGQYTATQSVTITDATPGASLYYTTNGSTPTASSTLYSGAISVGTTETINAIATAATYSNSAVGSAAYTISDTVATPTFSPVAGAYGPSQTVTINDATSGVAIHYTTNGTTPKASSALYSGPLTVGSSETVKAIGVRSGYSNSAVASAAYAINGTVATPTFSPAAGSYSGAQTVAFRDATSGATIYYTTDGTEPDSSSSLYSGPITVSASETISAVAVKSGYSNSSVASAAYIINGAAATPSFSPASGTYAGAQTVTISDSIASATLYYTTNGSTPTTASTLYTGPITVLTSETVNAIATAPNYQISGVGTGTYTLVPLAVPTFSPVSASYTAPQSVTISSGSPGTAIYYTTDGTTPTSSSTVYGGPITISVSETLNAIAVGGGLTSAVGRSSYTITTSAPTINYSAGFSSGGLSISGATISNGMLELTDGGINESNSAWYTVPINIQAFTTDFTFQNTAATANGFTFTIQNAPAGIAAVGGNGSNLGYGGIASSVGVKFDLYNSAGEGTDSTGFYTSGATPTVPSVDMTGSGVNLHSQDVMQAHLTYDGTTLTLTLSDTVTDSSFTTSAVINIPNIVGANTAYVGFTGGTSTQSAVQKLIGWTYQVNTAYGSPVGNLEVAADSATGSTSIPMTDTLYVGGWAADPTDGSPLRNVQVYIDGIAVGTPTLGIARPDVASYYNNPSYSNSGFSFAYPVGSLSTGPHNVSVVTTNGGAVSTRLGPLAIVITANYPAPVGNLEQANDASTGSTTVPNTDTVFISGWVADPTDGSPMSNVKVYIDGASVGSPTLGISRPDVASYYNNSAYANSGFNFSYSAPSLSAGTHSITVVAVNSHSVATTLGPRIVTIAAIGRPPVGNLEEAVDSAGGGSGISQSTGTLYVGGWAADYNDNGPAKQVQVFVDGTAVGLANLGESRPDVASYYNQPGWINSGYSLDIAASGFSQGTHTVVAIATDSLNLSTTLGPQTIVVGP